MKDRKICFQQYKEHLKDEAPRRRWNVVEEENQCLVLTKEDKTNFEDRVFECEQLTQEMKEWYGEPCFIYRFHRIRGNRLAQESYRMIFPYNGDMYEFSLITKNYGGIVKKDVLFNKLNDYWLSSSKNLSIPSSLQSVRDHFETLIKELPEFRLYHITGLV